MEFRQLGGSGLKVPALSLGTGTFGGGNDFFRAWGTVDATQATRLVDICLEVGLNMFDSADIYSDGQAEETLGKAIAGRRGLDPDAGAGGQAGRGQRADADLYWHQRGFAERNPPPVAPTR